MRVPRHEAKPEQGDRKPMPEKGKQEGALGRQKGLESRGKIV